jgi:hypothetical protein
MATTEQSLAFYSKPGEMTSISRRRVDEIDNLPNDLKKLVAIVQGLLIHQFVAEALYGVTVPDERIDRESHIRRAEELLDVIHSLDPAPLSTPREPNKRLVGVCHHFAKVLLAILRAKGVPARMRYGFGAYFNPGFYEDHSLVECWDGKRRCWILVDPQFDDIWRKHLRIEHDILDVPRDLFLTAGEAWTKCRTGVLDASKFGIFQGNLRGWWFVAGNLIKDIASLNKVEMLQWDAWTGMPRPNNSMRDKKRLLFFDRLAELTCNPDSSFKELRKAYASKKNPIQVPRRVFNAVRRHLEVVRAS